MDDYSSCGENWQIGGNAKHKSLKPVHSRQFARLPQGELLLYHNSSTAISCCNSASVIRVVCKTSSEIIKDI
jgi:hypothetical protein